MSTPEAQFQELTGIQSLTLKVCESLHHKLSHFHLALRIASSGVREGA
jgi:hypothetical protein